MLAFCAAFNFFSDDFAGKRKQIAGGKEAYKEIDFKIPIWATWYIWAFDHFFKHCIVLYELSKRNKVISPVS